MLMGGTFIRCLAMQAITIGVACLARKTFDFEAAATIYHGLKEDLRRIPMVDWAFIDDLIIEPAEAKSAARAFEERHVDGIVLISGTFHLGHLALEFNKLGRPILLWGLDELPYDGGKIRLNSVCGVNLDASNLYKAGNDTCHFVVGGQIEMDWIGAVRIKKAFSDATVALFGYRAQGFFNLDVDELHLHAQCGALVEHHELDELISAEPPEEATGAMMAKIKAVFDTTALDDERLQKVARLAAAIDAFFEATGVSAMAVRCWPEFASSYGISPCAAMSVVQSLGRVVACEGDVLGALSMLAHDAIGASEPFLADFSQVNMDEDFALMWHCGVAPCSTWDGTCAITLDTYFAGGKGVTAGFVMKPGDVSIARVDYARGSYRVFLQSATGVPMDKQLSGTYLKVVFPGGVRPVLERIVENGIAHHLSLVHGNHHGPLRMFAKLMGWKLIESSE